LVPEPSSIEGIDEAFAIRRQPVRIPLERSRRLGVAELRGDVGYRRRLFGISEQQRRESVAQIIDAKARESSLCVANC